METSSKILCGIIAILIVLLLFLKRPCFISSPLIDTYGPYELKFVNTCEMVRDAHLWRKQLPSDFDIVIGVPKSGLIIAAVIATEMDIPVGTLENLFSGKVYEGSNGKGSHNGLRSLNSYKKILVVDDTICSGTQLKKIKKQVESNKKPGVVVKYGALYIDCGQNKVDMVDYYYRILYSRNFDRRFEWNLVKSDIWTYSCSDLDGVLCYNPDPRIADSSDEYYNFLLSAKPFLIPKRTILTIVTGRNERFRRETEKWLKDHNVKYKHLIMSPYSDHSQDKILKSQIYAFSPARLFIESSSEQARFISRETDKPVFCIENMVTY